MGRRTILLAVATAALVWAGTASAENYVVLYKQQTVSAGAAKAIQQACQEVAADNRLPSSTNLGAAAPRVGWVTDTLPFLDQEPLYRQYDFTQNWYDPANTAVVPPITVPVTFS